MNTNALCSSREKRRKTKKAYEGLIPGSQQSSMNWDKMTYLSAAKVAKSPTAEEGKIHVVLFRVTG